RCRSAQRPIASSPCCSDWVSRSRLPPSTALLGLRRAPLPVSSRDPPGACDPSVAAHFRVCGPLGGSEREVMAASAFDAGRLLRLLVVALVVVSALVGCNGGTVDRHALTNDSSTLDSIACEGALLAADVARGRTTSFYAR